MTPPAVPSDRRARRRTWVGFLVLLLLPSVRFWRVAVGDAVFVMGDIAGFHHPYFAATTEAWRAFRAPLWNAYMFGGMPLLAGQQASPFYPLNVPLWLLLPTGASLQLTILLLVGLTGACAFLWLRSLGLRTAPAMLGGLVLGIGGFTLSHIGHVGILRALPWIPLACLAHGYWVRERRARWLALLSISTACIALSGYPQIVFYAGLFTGTYVLVGVRSSWRAFLPSLLAMLVGLGLAALQVWPGYEVVTVHQDLVRGSGGFDADMGVALHPHYLATWLFPLARAGSLAETVGYLGLAPLLLGLWGAVAPLRKNGWTRAFACVWIVVSILLSFGVFLRPLSLWIYGLPTIGEFGVPSKNLLQFTLAAALLVAFGFEALLARARPGARTWIGAAAVAALIGATWVYGNGVEFTERAPPVRLEPWDLVVRPQLVLFALSVVLIAGLALARRRAAVAWLSVLVLALTIVDVFWFALTPHRTLVSENRRFYTHPPAAATWVHEQRRGVFPDRVMTFDGAGLTHTPQESKAMLATNYFMSWGIESVLGHDGLMPTKYQRLARYRIPAWGETQTAALESPWFVDLLDLFGARWILVRREQRAPVAARYRYATSFADLDLFENPGALPRVFACAPEEEPPVAQGEVPGPPLRVAEDSGRAWLVDREFTARGIEPEHYEPGRVRAIVDTDRERLVLHGCNATSGWVALVDGHERPLRTVREALGGVVVPAGRHTVEFVYRPPAWPQGVKASGVSAVLFLLLLGVFRQRRSVA